MKRTATRIGMVAIGAWVCIVAGVPVVAQEATSRDNQTGSVVTVSGCLLQMSSAGSAMGGNTPDGTTPSASINQPSTASATDEERFILAGASARRYLVTGLKRDDLRKHINNQVELSGRVDRPGGATTPSVTARISELPQLNATSLRMIAGACSPPGSSD